MRRVNIPRARRFPRTPIVTPGAFEWDLWAKLASRWVVVKLPENRAANEQFAVVS